MSDDLKIVRAPMNDLRDMVAGLRRTADQIEAGEIPAPHNVVRVLDEGNCKITCRLYGLAAEPAAVAHLLLGIAQHQLETV